MLSSEALSTPPCSVPSLHSSITQRSIRLLVFCAPKLLVSGRQVLVVVVVVVVNKDQSIVPTTGKSPFQNNPYLGVVPDGQTVFCTTAKDF